MKSVIGLLFLFALVGCGGSSSCPSGQLSCGGKCIDVQSDTNNCGACSTVCASSLCVAGVCKSGGTLGCDTGLTVCSGLCVDLKMDNANCGTCGTACTGITKCASGACLDPCAPKTTCAGALICVNLQSDNTNCGTCGNVCPTAQSCSAGTCACPSGTPNACGAGNNLTCVSFATDVNNCGSCGNACGVNHVCSGGSCQISCQTLSGCPATGTVTYCADLTSDPMNCSTCGMVCPTHATCGTSACHCPSAVMSMVCNNTCVDLSSDAANCGGCTHLCNTGVGEACVLGVCQCPGVHPMTCSGQCVDLDSNAANCGSCGNACSGNNPCVGGRCSCGASTKTVSCGASCVNLNTDANNCGDCSVVCGTGNSCFDRGCRLSSIQGNLTLLAGTSTQFGSWADGTGSAAKFNNPLGIAADNIGNLWVADASNDVIRKIVIGTGVVTTLAGTPNMVGSSDGIGSAALFRLPNGIATDNKGNLFVAEHFNHTIRKIVIATAEVTTLAGTAGVSGTLDGVGASAEFQTPRSIASDGNDTLYVTEQGAGTIRKIVVSTQTVTTLTPTALGTPEGIVYDGAGNLYVSCYTDQVIRKIHLSDQSVSVVAGTVGMTGIAPDGGPGVLFSGPINLAYDGSAYVYIADYTNNLVRKMALSDYSVTTVTSAISNPVALAVTPAGGLVITNGTNSNTMQLYYYP